MSRLDELRALVVAARESHHGVYALNECGWADVADELLAEIDRLTALLDGRTRWARRWKALAKDCAWGPPVAPDAFRFERRAGFRAGYEAARAECERVVAALTSECARGQGPHKMLGSALGAYEHCADAIRALRGEP